MSKGVLGIPDVRCGGDLVRCVLTFDEFARDPRAVAGDHPSGGSSRSIHDEPPTLRDLVAAAANGMSVEQWSHERGLNLPSLLRWMELPRVGRPYGHQIDRLAEALGVNAEQVCTVLGIEPPPSKESP